MWRAALCDPPSTRGFEAAARLFLSLLIVAILAAILAGTGRTFYDLRLFLDNDFHQACKTLLVDLLSVLALVEVLRTALAYFSEGRVKVTYIIDTVLVTVLTEVLAFWYREMDWQELAMLVVLVITLAGVRIVAVRYSPRRVREEF